MQNVASYHITDAEAREMLIAADNVRAQSWLMDDNTTEEAREMTPTASHAAVATRTRSRVSLSVHSQIRNSRPSLSTNMTKIVIMTLITTTVERANRMKEQQMYQLVVSSTTQLHHSALHQRPMSPLKHSTMTPIWRWNTTDNSRNVVPTSSR